MTSVASPTANVEERHSAVSPSSFTGLYPVPAHRCPWEEADLYISQEIYLNIGLSLSGLPVKLFFTCSSIIVDIVGWDLQKAGGGYAQHFANTGRSATACFAEI